MCMLRNCKHRGDGFSAMPVMLGNAYRLPRHIVPTHYDLELTPDLTGFTFFGSVGIDIDVLEASSQIIINTRELKLGRIVVANESGTTLDGEAVIDEQLQRATISFGGTVGKGKWRLTLNFAGVLNDELNGFYRSVWKDAQGVEHVIATTQFEATDARRAFPCFDEPNMKATFKVTLNVPHDYVALSAMRPCSESTMSVESPSEFTEAGIMMMEPRLLKRVEFAVTPRMSTYYLAFVVGELASGGSVMVRDTELRFWTIPGMEDQLKFAQGVGAFAYDYLEKYCQTKYIGDDKIDFVAVPDFDAGAMENLGCIIYRMTDLLLNDATATQDERERVAHVVAHELVHMRFGDDATMDWWDNLWLNESFATLLENVVVDAMFPQWKTWNSFALSRASAFGLDQLHSTHAIQVPVDNPFEISQIFDLISYEKGCSVLRMIEQFIGPEAFREGVRIYCKRFHLANTVAEDLWNALEEGCQKTGVKAEVIDLMNKWVFTSGHPIVTVGGSELPGCIKLSQKEFKVLSGTGDGALWPVPLKLRAKTREGVIEQSFVFSDRTHDFYVGEGVEWVVVNAHGDGFFRVRYESDMLAKLLPNIKQAMGQIEQYNLLNDAWSATRALSMKVSDYLKLVDTLATSEDPNVWHRISGSLTYLHSVSEGPVKEAIAGKVRSLFKPLYAKLGVKAADGENDTKRMELRVRVLATLGTTGGYAPVIQNAREIYARWKKDPSSVDSDVFDAMLSVLCDNGDAKLFDEFDALRKSSPTAQEQQRFMYALTSFDDPALVQRSLALVFSGGIRNQDAPSFLARLLGQRASAAVVWAAVKDNWSSLKGKWTEQMVARLFGSLAILDTPEQEADVLAFFDANPVTTTRMKLAQGLEQLRISVLVRQAVKAEEGALVRYFLPASQEGCISPDVGATAAGAPSAPSAPAPAATPAPDSASSAPRASLPDFADFDRPVSAAPAAADAGKPAAPAQPAEADKK